MVESEEEGLVLRKQMRTNFSFGLKQGVKIREEKQIQKAKVEKTKSRKQRKHGKHWNQSILWNMRVWQRQTYIHQMKQ